MDIYLNHLHIFHSYIDMIHCNLHILIFRYILIHLLHISHLNIKIRLFYIHYILFYFHHFYIFHLYIFLNFYYILFHSHFHSLIYFYYNQHLDIGNILLNIMVILDIFHMYPYMFPHIRKFYFLNILFLHFLNFLNFLNFEKRMILDEVFEKL